MKLFSVPNLFSLGNLLCGCIATLNIVEGNLYPAAFLIALASVFDFLDGFAARGLKQGSPMGKELDSLADMVTFGVVPGMILFQLIRYGLAVHPVQSEFVNSYLPYLGFVIPLFSGLRLAKFNVDTRQSESFIGLPTLANAIFIAGIPLILELTQMEFIGIGNSSSSAIDSPENMETLKSYLAMHGAVSPDNHVQSLWDTSNYTGSGIQPAYDWLRNPWLLSGLTLVLSFLLISPLPMFSFKVKNVKWKGNEIRYIFLLLSAGLLAVFRLKAISMVIVLYILLSLLYAGMEKRRA